MALADGLANAPSTTPQLPTLLDGYAARPTWNVAGVDYAVGYASGTVLKDPSTISMAGVSVDKVNHIINISGSNVTLDGYDFSLNGGWGVSINGGSNATVENSKFVVGSNGNLPIYISPNASNATIQYNLIDGAGSAGSQMLIAVNGTGTTTIQYNMIQNAWGQDIVMSSDVGGENWIVQYNVIKDAGLGYAQGAHGDWIQTYNLPGVNTNSFQVNFNTFVQTAPISDGRTQGIAAFSSNSGSDSGGVQTESFTNNTFIAKNDAYVNYAIIVDTTRVIGTATVQDNYFDTTNIGSANGGGGGWEYVGNYNGSSGGPYHGTVTQSNNVNMVAGTYFNQSGTPPTGGVTTGTAPSAPIIANFSTDSGVAGDNVTSDNTLTLTGTAAANSTVKFYDGSTQIGSTTANSSGGWTYTTTTLSDATHTLKATATNSSGQTSAASAALTVTVDTKAPVAPTIAGNTVNSANQVVLSGNAEANSTIKVYDGTTQVGTATTNSSGAWNLTTSALSAGSHTLTAKATDAAGNVSVASSAVNPVIGSSSTGSVAAPVITSFSTDSGVTGDRVTSDSTLTLTGTAAAGSTVKVYDGTTQIGSTTANSSGGWSYTTSALSDATHTLTVTATNASGQTSAASSGLAVTVDTKAPTAPVISNEAVNSANQAVLSGTAEAGSTIKVYEGTTQVGTATTNSSGAWSVTTSALSTGSHLLTATATDAAGNASVASSVVDPVIGSPPAAPTISSFSTDTGVAGDRITSDNTLTLSGTAPAQSTVKVYDGTTQIGTATAGANGTWTYTTAALSDGNHSLTATDTVSGVTSAASAALAVTVDTQAPNVPTLSSSSSLFGSKVTGTAEAGSTVKVYEGTTMLGSAKAGADGSWSLSTSNLQSGAHTFVATATDAAGNTSALSQSVDSKYGWQGLKAFSTVGSGSKAATTTATADQSQVKLAATSVSSANTVDSTTKAAATSSSETTLSSSSSTPVSTTSTDVTSKGGADTFVFASNFGRDTIKDMAASGAPQETIKLGGSVFDSFASVLSQAAQSGHDAAVSTGSDTFALKNTKLDVLNHQDFHFA